MNMSARSQERSRTLPITLLIGATGDQHHCHVTELEPDDDGGNFRVKCSHDRIEQFKIYLDENLTSGPDKIKYLRMIQRPEIMKQLGDMDFKSSLQLLKSGI